MRTRSLLLAIVVCGSLIAVPGVAGARPTQQHGPLNYAGPNCPTDPGWNCTTDTTDVIQRTGSGGENVFECSGKTCSVVQLANGDGTNSAVCQQNIAKSGRQNCSIEQHSVDGDADASIEQVATVHARKAEVTQKSIQAVALTQTAEGDGGLTTEIIQQVVQGISIESNSDKKHKQEATQGLDLEQVSNTGNVTATIDQHQSLTSNAGAKKKVLQLQNAKDDGPDLLVDAAQDSTSGDISLEINQTEQLDQFAISRKAKQVQGADSGGQEAIYDVDPSPHSSGTTTVVVNQDKPWDQEAITPSGLADQAQIDKLRIRGLGLTPDEADLTQHAGLNSGPGAHQRCDQLLHMRVQEAGSYAQNCTVAGESEGTGNPNVPPNQNVSSTNTVERNESIVTGRVVDAETGDPIEGAVVDVFQDDEFYDDAVTAGDGTYTIGELVPDRFEIEAFHPDYDFSDTLTFKIEREGDDAVVNFELVPDPGEYA